MENEILTPIQLWSDYNPYKEPLRPSYLDIKEEQSFYHIESYINGDSYDNEPIRIFVKCYIPKTSTFNSSILIIGDNEWSPTEDAAQVKLAKLGYGVFTFDYAGIKKNTIKYTRYPKCINYANYIYSGEHLYKAIPTARDTSLFIWSKICRKVISFIKQTQGDDCQIILTGFKSGADIAWQVAAMDKRVDAVAAFLNAGWKEFRYLPKLSKDLDLNFNDERKRWLSGCATQAYIKFVNCPALVLSASNCAITSIDRLYDTAKLLKENQASFAMNVSVGQSDSITREAQILYINWINTISHNTKLPKMPRINLSMVNNALYANVDIDKNYEVEKITIHYSYDELDSTLRCWSNQFVPLVGLKTDIPVYDATKVVFAYASVKYKAGFEISSMPKYINVEYVDTIKRSHTKKSRIIYQRSTGTQGWLIEQNSTYVELVEPKIKTGPLNIPGITSDFGDLSTYTIGDYKFKCENQNLLQFDASSPKSRLLTVCICAGEVGTYDYYYATLSIKENVWTKCSLKLSDFKNSVLVPLKEWGNIKKLTFKNVDGTIFNNIIWV